MRVALYYAPAQDDTLWAAGCRWLGRDPETAAVIAQPGIPGLADATSQPGLYGFHATLKPPHALATSYDTFRADAAAIAAKTPPFDLPPLDVANISGFLALREVRPCPALQSLADVCVAGVDAHRAPPQADELARRRKAGLSPEQEEMLTRWGYPYVFGTWFFHMTLTRRLSDAEMRGLRTAARTHFASALAEPRRVADICVFTQLGPSMTFRIAERLPLRG